MYKLKELGKITERDILLINKQFERLDTGNCGRITLSNIIESHYWSVWIMMEYWDSFDINQVSYLSLWELKRIKLEVPPSEWFLQYVNQDLIEPQYNYQMLIQKQMSIFLLNMREGLVYMYKKYVYSLINMLYRFCVILVECNLSM